VLSIEESLAEEQRKKQEKSVRKQAEAAAASDQSLGEQRPSNDIQTIE
jgi:hypothetical protein